MQSNWYCRIVYFGKLGDIEVDFHFAEPSDLLRAIDRGPGRDCIKELHLENLSTVETIERSHEDFLARRRLRSDRNA